MPAVAIDFKYLRWIIGHAEDVEAIVASIQSAREAPTFRAKLLALRPVLSALADIMDDFPSEGFGATTEAEEPEYAANTRAEAQARGINWERLLALAEKLLPFILLFLEPKPQAQEGAL